ncbi:hypothetical protein [Natronorubrum sediminis]|nr:hypothetical protein [Natronorubrum sediminis]
MVNIPTGYSGEISIETSATFVALAVSMVLLVLEFILDGVSFTGIIGSLGMGIIIGIGYYLGLRRRTKTTTSEA